MNNFFDIDFIVIIGIILFISLKEINPYLEFLLLIIAIIAGIYKIIQYSTKKTNEELKKLKQENSLKN